MRLIIQPDYQSVSKWAAHYVAAKINASKATAEKPFVLGCPTGSSPLGMYRELIELNKKGLVSFQNVVTFNMDEYVGLPKEHPESYYSFMWNNFFDHINIDLNNTNVPCGVNMDAEGECARYDALSQSYGGIDLQLLGLGPNGHIGFNEPDDYFPKGTHKVQLTDATIQANKRFFEKEEDVPRYAYTMGICDIMQAKRVVMVVSGESKAGIVKEAFFGPVTPRVPASILQLHKDFTLVADEAALSQL